MYRYEKVLKQPRYQGSLLPVPTGTEREPGNEVGFEGYGSSQVLVIWRDTGQSASGVWKELFCFTGVIDVIQGAVVRRPISA